MKVQHQFQKNKDKKCSSAKVSKGTAVPSTGGCEKSLEAEDGPGHYCNGGAAPAMEVNGYNNSLNANHAKPVADFKDGLSNYNMLTLGKLLKPISGLDFPNDDVRSFAEMIQTVIVRGILSFIMRRDNDELDLGNYCRESRHNLARSNWSGRRQARCGADT